MPEFSIVDHPVLFPAACEVCGGAAGPMLDTGTERPAFGGPGAGVRVYICRSCSRKSAELWGYIKGERADELDAAADRLGDAEKERDEANDAAQKMANELTRKQQELISITTELERLRDLEHQRMFRLQQMVALGNELVVGSNGS